MTSIGIDIGSTASRAWVRGDAQADPAGSATIAPTTPGLLLHLGDPTPLYVDGVATSVTALLAEVLDQALTAVAAVAERHQPVVVVVPTAWGPTRQQQVRDALASIGAESVEIVSSAEAIVSMLVQSVSPSNPLDDASHAVQASEAPVADAFSSTAGLADGLIAVVDFGGHSTAGAVVRSADGSISLVGEPDGEESLGGLDLDDVVRGLLVDKVRGEIVDCWPQDVQASLVPDVATGVRLVRERLSAADEVVVDVATGASGQSVTVTAAEFAASARPVLERMASVVTNVITSATEEAAEVPAARQSVFLVGGVAHTPALADMVRARTGWPVVVPPHPELVAVRSAASWLPVAPSDASGLPGLEAGLDLLAQSTDPVDANGDSQARGEWARARPKIAAGVALGAAALIAYTLSTDAGAKQEATHAPDLQPGALRASASSAAGDTVDTNAASRRISRGSAAMPHLSAGSGGDIDAYSPAGDAPSTATTAAPKARTDGKTATGAARRQSAAGPRQTPGIAKQQTSGVVSGGGTNGVADGSQAAPGLSDSLQQLASDLFNGKTDRSVSRPNAGTPGNGSSQGRTTPSLPDVAQQVLDSVTQPKRTHTPKHAQPDLGSGGQDEQSQSTSEARAKARAARERAAEQRASREKAAEERAEHRAAVKRAKERAAKLRAAQQQAAQHAKPTAAQLEQQRQAKEFYEKLSKMSPEERANADKFFKNLAEMTPEERQQAERFFKQLSDNRFYGVK